VSIEDAKKIRLQIEDVLKKYGINHSTIQFEYKEHLEDGLIKVVLRYHFSKVGTLLFSKGKSAPFDTTFQRRQKTIKAIASSGFALLAMTE